MRGCFHRYVASGFKGRESLFISRCNVFSKMTVGILAAPVAGLYEGLYRRFQMAKAMEPARSLVSVLCQVYGRIVAPFRITAPVVNFHVKPEIKSFKCHAFQYTGGV